MAAAAAATSSQVANDSSASTSGRSRLHTNATPTAREPECQPVGDALEAGEGLPGLGGQEEEGHEEQQHRQRPCRRHPHVGQRAEDAGADPAQERDDAVDGDHVDAEEDDQTEPAVVGEARPVPLGHLGNRHPDQPDHQLEGAHPLHRHERGPAPEQVRHDPGAGQDPEADGGAHRHVGAFRGTFLRRFTLRESSPLGMFFAQDTGSAWIDISAGLPSLEIAALSTSPSGIVYCAPEGYGMSEYFRINMDAGQ